MSKDTVIVYHDDDGDSVACFNRRYMGGKYLSSRALCGDCPFEMHDLFSGTSGMQIWQYFCTFNRNPVKTIYPE